MQLCTRELREQSLLHRVNRIKFVPHQEPPLEVSLVQVSLVVLAHSCVQSLDYTLKQSKHQLFQKNNF